MIRRNYLAVLWVLAGVAVVRLLWQPVADPDLFWHLRAGRWMWEHRQFLRVDVFSHTLNGVPWFNFEFLSQILLHAVERVGGIQSVRILTVFCSLLSLGFLVVAARESGGRGVLLFLPAGLAFFLLHPRLLPRPEVFSWVFFAGLVAVVEAARRRGAIWEKRLPWIIGVLLLLWANAHLGFIYGVAYLAAANVGARWAGDRSSFIDRMDRSLVVALVCSFLTPIGPRVVGVFLETVFEVRGGLPVAEWTPTSILGRPFFWAVLLVSWGWIIRGFLRGEREAKRWALVLVGFGVGGSSIVRNTALFAFPLVPFTAAALESWRERHPRTMDRFWKGVSIAAVFSFLLWAVLRPSSKGVLSGWAMPVEACRFLQREGIQGRMFNSYGWGGYIQWALPDRRVFQDGRYLFMPFLLEEAALAVHWPDSDRRGLWSSYLDRYGVDYAVVDDQTFPIPRDFPVPLVLERFFPESRWALVYWDDRAWVFVKRTPRFESVIQRLEYKALRPIRQEKLFSGGKGLVSEEVRAELARHAGEVSFSRRQALLEEYL